MIRIKDPLCDVQQEASTAYCKRCGQEIYHDGPIVTEDGKRMHMECFEEYIEELLRTTPAIVAECIGMRLEEQHETV